MNSGHPKQPGKITDREHFGSTADRGSRRDPSSGPQAEPSSVPSEPVDVEAAPARETARADALAVLGELRRELGTVVSFDEIRDALSDGRR